MPGKHTIQNNAQVCAIDVARAVNLPEPNENLKKLWVHAGGQVPWYRLPSRELPIAELESRFGQLHNVTGHRIEHLGWARPSVPPARR